MQNVSLSGNKLDYGWSELPAETAWPLVKELDLSGYSLSHQAARALPTSTGLTLRGLTFMITNSRLRLHVSFLKRHGLASASCGWVAMK